MDKLKKSRSFDLRSKRYHGVGHRRRLRNDLNEAKLLGLKTYVYDGDVIKEASTSDSFTKRDALQMLNDAGSISASDLYQEGTPEYLLNQDVSQRFDLDPSLYSIDSYSDGNYATPNISIGYNDSNSIQNAININQGFLTKDSDGVLFMGDHAYDHREQPMFDANAHIAKLRAEEEAKRKAEEEAKNKAEEEAKNKAEEEYSTNHSFGNKLTPVKFVYTTKYHTVKNKKTGKVIKRTKETNGSFADPNMENKIKDFWKKLNINPDRYFAYQGNLLIQDISKNGVKGFIGLNANYNNYFINKNGDLVYDNGDGLTIWSNGRARFNGRLMSADEAIKLAKLQYETDYYKGEEEKKYEEYKQYNDSASVAHYADSVRLYMPQLMDSIRRLVYAPDSVYTNRRFQ